MPTEYQQLRDEIKADPSRSFWLKEAVAKLETRDPLDAANDAELLHQVQQLRWQDVSNPPANTWKEPQQAYKAGNRAWLPCTQELYDDALGAVPPLYIGQWWANSEPWTHAAGEPVYLCFRSSPRLACRMATPEELRAEQTAAKGTP